MTASRAMDDDPELQAIRARRLAELQRQQQQQRPRTTPGTGDAGAQEQQQKEEEMRNSILTQILSQEAGARRESSLSSPPLVLTPL